MFSEPQINYSLVTNSWTNQPIYGSKYLGSEYGSSVCCKKSYDFYETSLINDKVENLFKKNKTESVHTIYEKPQIPSTNLDLGKI